MRAERLVVPVTSAPVCATFQIADPGAGRDCAGAGRGEDDFVLPVIRHSADCEVDELQSEISRFERLAASRWRCDGDLRVRRGAGEQSDLRPLRAETAREIRYEQAH